jgi:hypothetical protein
MRIEITNIEQLILFIENAPRISDIDTMRLVSRTTKLMIPFYQTKEQTIFQLKRHFELFGNLPSDERPLFLCSKQKEFSIKDIFS